MGSYDKTGGTVLGGVMEVHSFERKNSQGDGYNMCWLLGQGCDVQEIQDSELSIRDNSYTASPTANPTGTPTAEPSATPTTAEPTQIPTAGPTLNPTSEPSAAPSANPTETPTTSEPTQIPTAGPTQNPTNAEPTANPTESPTTAEPTEMPTTSPTAMPLPLSEVQPELGCSNAAAITLTPPGVLTDIADAETCKAECDAFGPACDAAQFTAGWIAWGQGHTTGGYDDVVNTAEVQALLETTCKITPCGTGGTFCAAPGNSLCKAAGTFGCPDDEPCVSVGPASAGCGTDIGAHTAMECVDEDGVGQGSIDIGTVLSLDTGAAECGYVSAPQCGGNPHANSCFGPYQDSDVFEAVAGDELSWTYSAAAGGDWYEVMVLILRDGEPVAIPTYRYGDQSAVLTDTWTVDQASSSYQIRFVVGSYDKTGGTVLGGVMEVHSFERKNSQGEGYSMCRLLAQGCDVQEIQGSELSIRQ